MASVQANQVVKTEKKTIPLTDEERAHNKLVQDEVLHIKELATQLSLGLKVRQFGDISNSAKVYGPHSAMRNDVNNLANRISSLAGKLEKLLITEDHEKNPSGFALPSFFDENAARMVGIQPGTVLWPEGGRPVFSGGNFTSWVGHYVRINNLSDPKTGEYFRFDDYLKSYLGHYHGKPANEVYPLTLEDGSPHPMAGQPIMFNLEHLSFPYLQKITKDLVIRTNANSNPPVTGPVMKNPDGTPNELALAFGRLEGMYKQLKELKKAVKSQSEAVEKAEKGLQIALQYVQNGTFPPAFAESRRAHLQELKQRHAAVLQQYISQAAQIGIPKHSV